MVRSYARPVPILAALFAGALLVIPLVAGPALAQESGGALDRPVAGPVPDPEPVPAPEDWKLYSALDKVTVEERCPECCPLPGGLDHVANGGGARNEGHTTIELRAATPGAVPVAADLFVGVIFPGPPPPPTIVVGFEGHPVTLPLLGFSANPCWGGGVYSLYGGSVLPFIPPWINGDYQISGIPSFRGDGGDPWRVVDNTLPLAEGASLVVIFSHADVPAGSVVYTHTGPSTFLGGTITIGHPLAPGLPGTSYLRHTRIGADGQKGFFSATPAAPVAADTTAINGFQIKGVGAPDNQDSDWNGDDASRMNQLWDTQTTQVEQYVPALPMAAGDVAYTVTYSSPADCVSPSVHVLTSFPP